MTDKPIPDEKQIDLTAARMKRCRPVIKRLLQDMVDKELLLSDKTYIEQQIKGMLSALVNNIVTDHYNDLVVTLHETLEHMFREADKVVWGKDGSDLKFSDFDKLFQEYNDEKDLKDDKK